jgi:hypothetical protein
MAGATYAGIRTYTEDKLDLGILCSESVCSVAGTFTTNKVKSPTVLMNQQRVATGRAQAVVINSGIANACVGEQGMTDAIEMAALAAAKLGLEPELALACSTGLIGVELPMGLIRNGVKNIEMSVDGGHELARAICTTDTVSKEAAVSFEVGGVTYTLDDIEHGIIRKEFDDPRIHFALVCAAVSCPPLRQEAYIGTHLNDQLNDQSKRFLMDSPEKNRVDIADNTVYLTKVFDWYARDFGKNDAEITRYLARFFPPGPERTFLASGKARIRFTDYDWTLNIYYSSSL